MARTIDVGGEAGSPPGLGGENEEALAGHGHEVISTFLHPNLLIVLCVNSREPSRESLPSILTKLAGQAASGRHLHFGVSPVFHSLTEAYVHGHEAIESVQLGALQERTVTFSGKEVRSRKNRGLVTALELEKELVNFLFNGGEDELKQVWGKIMEQYRIKGCSLAEIDQAYKELKIVIQRRLRTSGIELSEELVSILEGTIDLYANNSYRAIEALIRSELMSLFSSIHSTLGGKNHWTVDRVTKYIEAHHSTDLKASEVAAWLKITPNYFSIIFNQSFGKGFAEYLNEVRIEHAKEMLSGTHDRVFEIAEKVGYNDYKYFCSIFKAHTGVTPTQYRKLADSTTA
ncbi:AraC family transcriptional regulator [Paenibacillus sp. CC-CFT747]|nr:AraC family transcriptional regulator [Paenibacillus sp. CC-CFT747]